MSDNFEYIRDRQHPKNRVCHVAYTLNNTQPVICSIIGDQPLFYMDYDGEYEDHDMAFEDSDFSFLESEIETLKKEIKGFERFSSNFTQEADQCFQDFLDNRDILKRDNSAQTDIETLLESLKSSRSAKTYIDFAQDHNVQIKLSGQIKDAAYDRKAGIIHVNKNASFADQILLAARELRRHWQHRQGALIHPLTFHPDNAVLVNRLQEADLATAMVRIAWELQLAGIKSPWERIENSSMMDLGRAFAQEAFLDFRTINNGQASASVIETWFLSERARVVDKNLIQQMLADYQGYVFEQKEADTVITSTLIGALGEMPFGKNYLAQHAATIMNDPIFGEVRDRSNANFLWFIKFERSFRETEQELQNGEEPTADGLRLMASQTPYKDFQDHDDQQQTDIITLYPGVENNVKAKKTGKRLKPVSSAQNSKNKNSAEIIYLRRWSGE